MSDKSPEETPEENPLDESALDEPTANDAEDAEDADDVASEDGDVEPEGDDEPEAESDDDVISRLDEDLPADETEKAAAPIRRRTAKAPVKKTTATKKRSEAEKDETDPYKAKNPAHYVRQSVGELKRVTWPTWNQLVTYFFAVLIFVLFIIAFVGLLDAGFGWGLLQLLGN